MTATERFLPWGIVVLGLIYIVAAMMPPSDSGAMRLHEFAALPVVEGGRVKPIDTVARVSLMVISGRQTFRDKNDREQPAVRWLLDVMSANDPYTGAGAEHKVFRIENDQVLNLLKLEARPGSFRYSLAEIGKNFDALKKELDRVKDVDPAKRDLFDVKVAELGSHLRVYEQLATRETPLVQPVPGQTDQKWLSLRQADFDAMAPVMQQVKAELQRDGIDPNKLDDKEWNKLMQRVGELVGRKRAAEAPVAEAWSEVFSAYRQNDAGRFNKAVAGVESAVAGDLPKGARGDDRLEVFFNDFAPFYQCTILYVFVGLLACAGLLFAGAGWPSYARMLNRAAFWLAVLTLVVQTWAILTRMYLQGRPPVTNLYSSAVFIGWVCLVFALVLEAIFKIGLGNVIAAVTGFSTMIIAHYLGGSGDTLEMMQAVLDTNFWLATHVTCITMGYGATFVAGKLGILFVILGLAGVLRRDVMTVLAQMIYGVICAATLFSFVGTVLGGIWADQSWGRFWGWDPKENGAVLIVIWNALILHARWAGMVKQRGMAMLAIAGNMVVGWSWFGTNQLGVGLHAYGFNNTLATALAIYWVTQMAFIAAGLTPMKYWANYGAAPLSPPKEELPPVPEPRGRKKRPEPATGIKGRR
jgi:ABC-type transport system involved in cytochrome c biogenesis permease subunit